VRSRATRNPIPPCRRPRATPYSGAQKPVWGPFPPAEAQHPGARQRERRRSGHNLDPDLVKQHGSVVDAVADITRPQD